jgi:hypothetical protein
MIFRYYFKSLTVTGVTLKVLSTGQIRCFIRRQLAEKAFHDVLIFMCTDFARVS